MDQPDAGSRRSSVCRRWATWVLEGGGGEVELGRDLGVENLAFGEDRPGTAHGISLAFFFVGVVAAVALLGLLVAALIRRLLHR